MKRAEILETAKRCVCGQREEDYGSPEDNFALIARFWEGYLTALCAPQKVEIVIALEDVAVMMCLFKIARVCTGTRPGTTDSYVDLAGYAACGGEIAGKQTGE